MRDEIAAGAQQHSRLPSFCVDPSTRPKRFTASVEGIDDGASRGCRGSGIPVEKGCLWVRKVG